MFTEIKVEADKLDTNILRVEPAEKIAVNSKQEEDDDDESFLQFLFQPNQPPEPQLRVGFRRPSTDASKMPKIEEIDENEKDEDENKENVPK